MIGRFKYFENESDEYRNTRDPDKKQKDYLEAKQIITNSQNKRVGLVIIRYSLDDLKFWAPVWGCPISNYHPLVY